MKEECIFIGMYSTRLETMYFHAISLKTISKAFARSSEYLSYTNE